jgi:hypothetical protein
MTNPLTVHRSPFTVRYPLSVIHEATRLKVNGKCMVNSKWLIANGRPEAV